MESIFYDLIVGMNFTSDLSKDSNDFLIKHGRHRIAEHSLRVAQKSKEIARQYGFDEKSAEIAGLLHDIGGVYLNEARVSVANSLGVNILPEEESFPLILHQKISKVMAKEIFDVNSYEILNAIGCHTTLKASSSRLDKILFIADKIEWDQEGEPPYIDEIQKGVNISLEEGAYAYLRYIWENKTRLKVIHPWMAEAYLELKNKLGK